MESVWLFIMLVCNNTSRKIESYYLLFHKFHSIDIHRDANRCSWLLQLYLYWRFRSVAQPILGAQRLSDNQLHPDRRRLSSVVWLSYLGFSHSPQNNKDAPNVARKERSTHTRQYTAPNWVFIYLFVSANGDDAICTWKTWPCEPSHTCWTHTMKVEVVVSCKLTWSTRIARISRYSTSSRCPKAELTSRSHILVASDLIEFSHISIIWNGEVVTYAW